MFIIFGNRSGGVEDLGAVAPFACPNCHNEAFLHLVKTSSQATLFFVPVLTYSTQYYLACEICHLAHELDEERAKDAQTLVPLTEALRASRLTREQYLTLLNARTVLSRVLPRPGAAR